MVSDYLCIFATKLTTRIKLMKRAIYLFLSFAILLSMVQKANAEDKKCPLVKVEAERLPDLNVPRSGHSAFVVNGELTVVGGHTSGFVLTPTAEYYKDGEWHLMQTVYPHDGGFYVALKSGKVLLAGGFKDNLGIGQSFEVETYDPIAHRFDGLGCLEQKRASAAALELDSGRVLITGNWYADDEMELFDGHDRFNHLKPIHQPRYLPHLFRTSDGDVMIVGFQDNKGQLLDTLLIERMNGEPFRAPLFDIWRPLQIEIPINSDDFFIGDREKGDYAYLMPVKNRDGQVAIAEVRDTVFSLLPTDCPVPTKSQWGVIYYYSPFYADRLHQQGYVMGCDSTGRQYTLCIDYSKTPAHLTLYHTDPLTDVLTLTIPIMMDDGNLVLTGIKPAINYNSNFTPTPQVWLLRFNKESAAFASNTNYWLWAGLALAIVALMIIGIALKRKNRQATSEEPSSPQSLKGNELLMQRICHLMDEQQLYLRPGLKVSDIAVALGTNSRYVSDCIKAVKGISMSQFINDYRVEHAKQLLRENPDMKISVVATESGFSNDKALTRYFKDYTGMTPTDWKTMQNNPQNL